MEVIQWIPRIASFGISGFCYLFVLELRTEGWKAALSHFIQGSVLLIRPMGADVERRLEVKSK